MDERQTIAAAFSDTVRNSYTVFFETFTMAQGDAAKERQAIDRFRAAILHARHVRDLALASLP